jgi:hypothetical protein
VTIYKTLIRPVLAYGAEAWVLSKQDEMQLGCFEGKYFIKFTDPCIFEENGEEEPILNFISYIMMIT